ncbi:MAG: prephenate dehydrogenase [Lysobacter sp.]|nr:MAG: prephenate dehydrogenase [Lysobacter sp.]
MSRSPVIGLVGSAGAYGRWLRTFFEARMGLVVLGHDPAAPESDPIERLLQDADVLLFAAPIRDTVATIDDWAQRSSGRERGRLWLDVTSIKQAPVAAMLRSQAEVVGLHPMTAPPKSPTLKGRVLAVCEARLDAWRPWVSDLLQALQAECVRVAPERHDRAMALIQAMVHASHLAEAGVLRDYAAALGAASDLLPLRTASFELDVAMMTRILSLNPQIYEDIQFCNPYVPEMLDRLLGELGALRDLVARGDADARAAFRARFLDANRDALGERLLAEGNYAFERVGYLLADLVERPSMSVHLPEDRPGALRALLDTFERHGVSLSSIHSSRTPAGEVHFRIGFGAEVDAALLGAVAAQVDAAGVGRVLECVPPPNAAD